jgi:hypothetical protein
MLFAHKNKYSCESAEGDKQIIWQSVSCGQQFSATGMQIGRDGQGDGKKVITGIQSEEEEDND